MAIKPVQSSKADRIVYRGAESFVCPHCHTKQETVAIELRQHDPSQGSDIHLSDPSVVQVVVLEELPLRVEIVYYCEKCHLQIKFTRKIEGVPGP